MKDFAVVSVGGKQRLVKAGERLVVPKLAQTKKVEFKDLLSTKLVRARVIESKLGKKIAVRKFKSKARYLRRRGYRDRQTVIEIQSIKAR